MAYDGIREIIDTYTELVRLHQLNMELLETLELSFLWLKDSSEEQYVPLRDREKIQRLLRKAYHLMKEILKPST